MAMGNVNSNLLRKYKNKDIHRHCIDICSYLQVFFIIKVYFPNLDWVGGISVGGGTYSYIRVLHY